MSIIIEEMNMPENFTEMSYLHFGKNNSGDIFAQWVESPITRTKWFSVHEVDELNMPKVIHAKWIDINGADVVPNEDGQITGEAFCSHCNCYLGGSSEYTVNGKYCSSCGAIMDLGV